MDLTVEKIYKDIVDYMSTMNKTAEEAILVYGSEILLLALMVVVAFGDIARIFK